MKKKKSDYFGLCYFGLVMLIILLLLPVGLRMFGKDLYGKKEVKKDVVTVLNCSKGSETINSTFLNDEPKNLDYKILGDYRIVEEDNIDKQGNNSTISNTSMIFMELIREHAKITYLGTSNITTFNVNVEDLKQVKNYVGIFSSIDNQKNYFESQAFNCTLTKY